MHGFSLPRRLAAEGLGTAFLLAIVIGSGIMGERLSGGNVALALLGNTLATGAGLVVLISVFGPVSGAHFNPAVTVAMLMRRAITPKAAAAYVGVQAVAAILGVWAAHLMFGEPVLQVSHKLRDGPALAWSEFVATFGLFAAIFGVSKFKAESVGVAVGLYITAAYWFTASTSFANPAVTIARTMSDTFAGIAPASAPWFILAQFGATVVATALFGWLFKEETHHGQGRLPGDDLPQPRLRDVAQHPGDDPRGRVRADGGRVPEGRLDA